MRRKKFKPKVQVEDIPKIYLRTYDRGGIPMYLVSSKDKAQVLKFQKKWKIQSPVEYSQKYKNYYVLIPLRLIAPVERYFSDQSPPKEEFDLMEWTREQVRKRAVYLEIFAKHRENVRNS